MINVIWPGQLLSYDDDDDDDDLRSLLLPLFSPSSYYFCCSRLLSSDRVNTVDRKATETDREEMLQLKAAPWRRRMMKSNAILTPPDPF